MRAVNLLPQDEQRARLEGGRIPLLAAAGGVALVTVMAFMLSSSASGSAAETEAERDAVEAAIARLPEAPAPEVSQGVLAQERSDRVAALSAALSSRVSFDRLLRHVSLVLPDDVWLTGLSASQPQVSALPPGVQPTPSAPASAPTLGVTIQGSTFSHNSVARVLSRLAVVPSLENVTLTGTALVQPEASDPATTTKKKRGRPVVTFTISASLRTGASS
jgi:Tfp pilus assembly protein PilN